MKGHGRWGMGDGGCMTVIKWLKEVASTSSPPSSRKESENCSEVVQLRGNRKKRGAGRVLCPQGRTLTEMRLYTVTPKGTGSTRNIKVSTSTNVMNRIGLCHGENPISSQPGGWRLPWEGPRKALLAEREGRTVVGRK